MKVLNSLLCVFCFSCLKMAELFMECEEEELEPWQKRVKEVEEDDDDDDEPIFVGEISSSKTFESFNIGNMVNNQIYVVLKPCMQLLSI
uniref:Uncharacterized protein n=1 Tax=Amazona collaria TaxID=241587 RepID=A0A8B9GLD2_9PSIT